jgi:hypothetical protein
MWHYILDTHTWNLLKKHENSKQSRSITRYLTLSHQQRNSWSRHVHVFNFTSRHYTTSMSNKRFRWIRCGNPSTLFWKTHIPRYFRCWTTVTTFVRQANSVTYVEKTRIDKWNPAGTRSDGHSDVEWRKTYWSRSRGQSNALKQLPIAKCGTHMHARFIQTNKKIWKHGVITTRPRH